MRRLLLDFRASYNKSKHSLSSPKQRTQRHHLNIVCTILPDRLQVHGPAELAIDHLHAIANAQHRQAQLENVRIVLGRIGGVHRIRAARNDDALVAGLEDLFGVCVQRQDVRVDLQLADASVDYLG